MLNHLAASRSNATAHRLLRYGRRQTPLLIAAVMVCLLEGLLTTSAQAQAKPAVSGSDSANLPEVEVTGTTPASGSEAAGYRVDSARLGPLGVLKLQDTPYSINVVSQDFIKNIQATTVEESLQYNPTVNTASGMNLVGGGGSFSIRGFTSTNSTIDGLRAPSIMNIPVQDKDAIEVMNGPTGFLYGVGNPGGTLNFVLKRPTDTPLATINTGISAGTQEYTEGDFGGPLDKNGQFAYRLNLLYVDDGETAITGQTDQQDLETLAIDCHYAPEGTLSFDLSHYETSVQHGADLFNLQLSPIKKGGVLYPGLTSVPSVPDATANFMPDFSTATDRYDRVGTELNQKINDSITLRGDFAYTDCDRLRHRAADTLLDDEGDYWLSRNYYSQDSITPQGNLFLDAVFQTWNVEHKLTLGVTDDYSDVKYAYPYQNNTSAVNFGLFNLYDGTPVVQDKPGTPVGQPNLSTQKINYTSSIIADTVTLNDQWSLLAGGAYAHVLDKQWSYSVTPTTVTGSALPENNKGQMTPAGALMFKPVQNVTTYVSYIEGLQEGATAPSSSVNAGQTLAPYVSQQVELGAKSQIGGLSLNGALFHIEQPYAFTDATDDIFKSAGSEVHQGGEIVASGKISRDWTLTGGFTLLTATVEDVGNTMTTGAGGRKVRLRDTTPAGVPDQIGRLYAEYAVPAVPGLFLNAGITYTGGEWVDPGDTLSIPWSMTGNIGIRYETQIYGHPVTTRFNIENVSGQDYWVATGSGLALGQPRTFSFSVQLAWF